MLSRRQLWWLPPSPILWANRGYLVTRASYLLPLRGVLIQKYEGVNKKNGPFTKSFSRCKIYTYLIDNLPFTVIICIKLVTSHLYSSFIFNWCSAIFGCTGSLWELPTSLYSNNFSKYPETNLRNINSFELKSFGFGLLPSVQS